MIDENKLVEELKKEHVLDVWRRFPEERRKKLIKEAEERYLDSVYSSPETMISRIVHKCYAS